MGELFVNSVNAQITSISSAISAASRAGLSAGLDFEQDMLICNCGNLSRQIDLKSGDSPQRLKALLSDLYAVIPSSAAC